MERAYLGDYERAELKVRTKAATLAGLKHRG